jgi:hypothetical protein
MKRGVRPIVTKRRRGMRWTRSRHQTCDVMRTAKACGPGALVAGAKLASDDLQATVTQKPVSPGRARDKPLTPSRRECRCFGFICGDYTCVLSTIAHKAAGAAKHPAFPAPSLLSRDASMIQSSGAIAPRGCGRASFAVIASVAKQSRAAREILDCFVASLLAMTRIAVWWMKAKSRLTPRGRPDAPAR